MGTWDPIGSTVLILVILFAIGVEERLGLTWKRPRKKRDRKLFQREGKKLPHCYRTPQSLERLVYPEAHQSAPSAEATSCGCSTRSRTRMGR